MTLSVRNLHVQLGSNHVLKGLDFSVDSNERVAIIGPNGSGKSTLLRAIAGILKPSSGVVHLDETPIQSHRRTTRARKLGFLSQGDVIPMMTSVREHVAIGRHPHRTYFRQNVKTDQQAIDLAIQLCEIEHLVDRRVERLSGGERQRVRIATLLAQAPQKLLLDEPLTGLDVEHQYALLHLLQDLNRDHGRMVVVVLHDISIAMRFFDRLLVIQDGQLVADGVPDEVVTTDLLRDVFRIHASIGRDPESNQPIIVCHRDGSSREAGPSQQDLIAAGPDSNIMAHSH